ncbi:hypothetical protein [Microbacterium sp. VKM Ac-2923]|uniref:hypothetical protein n=1 Tax=Microbacterium sp. VKM Ac-2923 TaxID=2929476 RepID=UPI001FB274A2|nr:hypothetical protein [Microbacterium sp. VKM Ac-2923]MCJ1707032.1 hypothetical protein [Microbacterium sp. VKM Ac-2923]
MKRITQLVTLVALTTLLAGGFGTAASARGTAAVSASPSTVAVNETTTITATGLGGLEDAFFGLAGSPGGLLSTQSGGVGSTDVSSPANDGQATAYFRATQAGTFTVAVGDGETVLGTVSVTVSGSAPQPTATSQTPIIEVDSALVVGQKTQVEAKVSGLETVGFGLDSTDGGSFSDGSSTGPSITTAVTDGTATVEFTPARAGSVTIALSDGETVLASAVVQVSAASASPSATPTPSATPSASPTPAPVADSATILPWVLLIVAVLVIAGLVVWLVISRRRGSGARRSGPTAD